MPNDGRTSIVVVAYNHKKYLADCVHALERAGLPHGAARLILIDNASTDGTAEFVRRELLLGDCKATKGGIPCEFIAGETNLGFAGGNNLAIDRALADGDAFVYLLNPDTEAQPGFLQEAIAVMGNDARVGVVQSQLRLHPRTELINTWGNEIHYLGFGYAGGESVPADSDDARRHLRVRDIAYASGAGMLIDAGLLRGIGGLDEELFAYHEDLEFSWRARLAGRRVVLAPGSLVFHKYEFSRSIKKYYWMERNRFLVMAWCYSLTTLLLILPALLVMELGLWLFAFKSGWWKEKLRAYAYVLNPLRWPEEWKKRARIQSLRRVSEREATAPFTGAILFQQMQPALLTRVANPLFSLYWSLIRLIMFW